MLGISFFPPPPPPSPWTFFVRLEYYRCLVIPENPPPDPPFLIISPPTLNYFPSSLRWNSSFENLSRFASVHFSSALFSLPPFLTLHHIYFARPFSSLPKTLIADVPPFPFLARQAYLFGSRSFSVRCSYRLFIDENAISQNPPCKPFSPPPSGPRVFPSWFR